MFLLFVAFAVTSSVFALAEATWATLLRELLLYCLRCSFYIYFIIMLLRTPQLEEAAGLPNDLDRFWAEFCKLIAFGLII
jgi:hypothetical protein